MVDRRYVPDRGDLVWLNFDPQSGREQAGHRPAVVLSPVLYNGRTGLAVVCPITSKSKGYPFEVALPAGFQISGVALADHVRSVDWKIRQARYVAKVSARTLDQIGERISALLDL